MEHQTAVRSLAERIAAMEAVVQMHLKSCDRKGTITITLLGIVLAAALGAFGIVLRAQLHLG